MQAAVRSPAPAPVGVSVDYPLLIQKVRNLSWPTLSRETVMANIEAESGHAEQLRLLGIELLCGEHARVPECCQLR
jgi:hypothetical protein